MNSLYFPYFSETDFEKTLFSKGVLGTCEIIEYKSNISSSLFSRRHADALIINKKNGYWAICELEISSHSLRSHIFPQLVQIYNLIETNRAKIVQDILENCIDRHDNSTRELILRNKPYLHLVIDTIPKYYANTIPLINTFCNITTCKRYKDEMENYQYLIDEYFMEEVRLKKSKAICQGKFIIILNPNLLVLDHNHKFVVFNELKHEIDFITTQDNKGIEYFIIVLKGTIKQGEYNILFNKHNQLQLEK
jgi:hypothetical protein